MYCENCGEKLAEGAKFCTSCGIALAHNTANALTKAEYFSISNARLMLFSVLTFNLYQIYWSYRNWDAVRKAEQSNIQPFWRGIFTVFFCYDLFKKILQSAKRNGYNGSYSPGWMAALFILFLVGGNALGRMEPDEFGDPMTYLFWTFVLCVLTVLPLFPVQNAINYQNEKVGSSQVKTTTFTGGEVALIIVGIIITSLVVLGTLASY